MDDEVSQESLFPNPLHGRDDIMRKLHRNQIIAERLTSEHWKCAGALFLSNALRNDRLRIALGDTASEIDSVLNAAKKHFGHQYDELETRIRLATTKEIIEEWER